MKLRLGGAVAMALLLLYGLPLFVPPAAVYPAPPLPDAGFWQRLFPQVPAWWVVGRLLCLCAGAGWLAWSLRAVMPLRLPGSPVASRAGETSAAHTAANIALLLAFGHAASGLLAAHFNRLAETVYFFLLIVPALLLAVDEPLRISRTSRRRLAALLILPAIWLALSAATAWRSPRAANLVDMWIMVERLEQVVTGSQKILADSADPGHSNAYMMLEGAPLIGTIFPLGFVGLQLSHFFWTAVCGVATGIAVWRMVAWPAAIVGQAVFLFSPWAMSTAYNPGMNQIAPLCTVALLVLLLAVRELKSNAALAAFGAVAGFSSTEPTAYLTTFVLCLVMAYTVLRMSPLPWRGLGIAALSFTAAALPGLPDLAALPTMVQQYTFGRGQLASVILVLFGQDSVPRIRAALEAGSPGPLDIPLGALLSPFAIARIPLRLWGDTLVDPLGAALMAIGLVLCVLHVLRNRAALFVLALLVGSLVHAFTSRGDAVSHARLVAAFVPIALLAGVGFEALRNAVAPRRKPATAGALAAALIAAGGAFLFLEVNPRILPASRLAISFEALGTSEPNADAVVLTYGDDVTWMYERYMAALLPARPLPVMTYSDGVSLATTPEVTRKLLLWDPGLEQGGSIARSICQRWPQAALYTLSDEARLFRAFAACPGGDLWHPRLPSERWRVASCEAGEPPKSLLDEQFTGIVSSTDG